MSVMIIVTFLFWVLKKFYFVQEICIMFRGENELDFELKP